MSETVWFCTTLGGAILVTLVFGILIWRRWPRLPQGKPDPYLQAVVEHCWKTGKTVTGTVDDEGRLTITEIEKPPS